MNLRNVIDPVLRATSLLGVALVWTVLSTPLAVTAQESPEAHAGHDHADEEEDEEGALRLTAEQRERFGIAVCTAGPGSLRSEVRLTGEIGFNEDRVVHMVPRVAGIVREVHKTVGDRVAAGEVLAVVESRELAGMKSECLAAKAREILATKVFAREQTLRQKQVSSEQDYLESEQALAEARIALRATEQSLRALGFTAAMVAALSEAHDETLTRYEIVSPLDGIVTEKHIALGESVAADTDIFTVADLAVVWINLTVYAKDLAAVREGATVELRLAHSGATARGAVARVTPFVETATRTARARVLLDNADGTWMPGTFVTAFLGTSDENVPVVVPRHAVQNLEGREVVFVEHEGAFEATPVIVGRADRTQIEVVAGLPPGTHYVAEGAFQLKATIITSELGSHAGHGH